MDYTVNYLPDEDYIEIKLQSRVNFQTVEQYSKEAVKLARHHRCSKFVIDHTKNTLKKGIYQLHTSGEELQQFGFTDKDRIAVLVADIGKRTIMPDSSTQGSRFCVVKYFSKKNFNEAKDWLNAD